MRLVSQLRSTRKTLPLITHNQTTPSILALASLPFLPALVSATGKGSSKQAPCLYISSVFFSTPGCPAVPTGTGANTGLGSVLENAQNIGPDQIGVCQDVKQPLALSYEFYAFGNAADEAKCTYFAYGQVGCQGDDIGSFNVASSQFQCKEIAVPEPPALPTGPKSYKVVCT